VAASAQAPDQTRRRAAAGYAVVLILVTALVGAAAGGRLGGSLVGPATAQLPEPGRRHWVTVPLLLELLLVAHGVAGPAAGHQRPDRGHAHRPQHRGDGGGGQDERSGRATWRSS
jgi:hypothetical protein